MKKVQLMAIPPSIDDHSAIHSTVRPYKHRKVDTPRSVNTKANLVGGSQLHHPLNHLSPKKVGGVHALSTRKIKS